MIRLACPHCGAKLNAKEKLAGTTLPCPKCRQPVTVPEGDVIQLDDAPAESQDVPVEIIHTSPDEVIHPAESTPAPTRLNRQNRYLICDPTSVVATWKNDGRGWMLRVASGFSPAKRNRDILPAQGKFVLVELAMETVDEGLRLDALTSYALLARFALTKLDQGDDEILQAITGPGCLNRAQKNAIRLLFGDLFMREVWGDSTDVLDYLANADYHSPGSRPL
ncbi:MAG: hypothetical protein JW818_06985 [Pirellulales bacterium]|nr:hypothetical protein [Pirellulales bacterium]